MRSRLARLAPAALLLLLACQPRTAAPVFGPWEEGLTLNYEDPSAPQPKRSAERLQVRVAKATFTPGSPSLIQVDMASSQGQLPLTFKYDRGGIALVDGQGEVVRQILPAGFPAVDQWTDHGIQFRLMGRATWEGATILPATADPVGYWVEARTPKGLVRRTLYLPNLGEVESREQRDGAWVTISRLVARGFTDIPAIKRS
ncbi:hypothetical protein [Geothrix sp. PMB-07]|uniref:hypothetical protein n=1 Tax=Geothrix sp. PMB-07 TaxID=3068640 RepID=UPI002741358E|nr:hypothetical protein [Geothrix sp. PMB-07]WLT30358.1 hypothetical protein Q9293_11575 [Geothrix sp. PMB-07]